MYIHILHEYIKCILKRYKLSQKPLGELSETALCLALNV